MPEESARLLRRLVNLGLSEREAKLYLALLRRHSATAAELQSLSGIPQTKVYEIIRRLMRQGYCLERRSGQKRTFEASDPRAVISLHMQRLQNNLEDARRLQDDLGRLYSSVNSTIEPADCIEILRGGENLYFAYQGLQSHARSEIIGFTKPPYPPISPDRLAEQVYYYKDFLAQRGRARWVHQMPDPSPEWLIGIMRQMVELGVQIRVSESLPLKMIIFDAREVVITQEIGEAAPADFVVAVVKQPTIANAYRALFDYFWMQAEDFTLWEQRTKT